MKPNTVLLAFAVALSFSPALAVAQANPAVAQVNPFTGTPATLEARQRDVENAKLDSVLLEEQVKQARLKADLETVPVKKAAELAQVKAQMEVAQAQARAKLQDERIKTQPAPKPAPAPVAVKPAAPPPPPPINLVSIMTVKGKRSAVLTQGANSLVVADGEQSPLGRVRIIDNQTAQVGLQQFRVHDATLARMAVSDVAAEPVADVRVPRGNMQPVVLPPALPITR